MIHIGIDYGSKLAGTTVICYLERQKIQFVSAEKGQDADQMIHQFLKDHQNVDAVFMDAPLSLPHVYIDIHPETADFFYRSCDRAVKAMSPMFLGGLTARAMKLAHGYKDRDIEFFESYPAALAKELSLDRLGYKKSIQFISEVTMSIHSKYELSLASVPKNWHEVDALLAYLIGWRFSRKEHQVVGEPSEGLIYY